MPGELAPSRSEGWARRCKLVGCYLGGLAFEAAALMNIARAYDPGEAMAQVGYGAGLLRAGNGYRQGTVKKSAETHISVADKSDGEVKCKEMVETKAP